MTQFCIEEACMERLAGVERAARTDALDIEEQDGAAEDPRLAEAREVARRFAKGEAQ